MSAFPSTEHRDRLLALLSAAVFATALASLACAALLVGNARAQDKPPDRGFIVSGFLSTHLGPSSREGLQYNERNIGLGYMRDEIAFGAYKNSLDRTSVYVAVEKRRRFFGEDGAGIDGGLLLGGVTGYKWAVTPLALPELVGYLGRNEVALIYTPPIHGLTPAVIAVQYRRKL